MSAADYINEYVARRAPFYMEAPWRSSNPLVRALWAKQERWTQSAKAKDAAKPSAEYDEAYDLMDAAAAKHAKIIKDAWTNRCMSRGYVPSKAAA
jgi:hypothetical protein